MVVGCIIGLGSRCCCVNSVGSYDLYSFCCGVCGYLYVWGLLLMVAFLIVLCCDCVLFACCWFGVPVYRWLLCVVIGD